MNFLAHLYLSGNDPLVMSGNFIGDAVKGKKHEEYPERIQRGILLHRAIDHYTDIHDSVMRDKERLMPHFRKYAGVVLDVYYDHFLATNWHDYHDEPLEEFVGKVYQTLEEHHVLFPRRSQNVLYWMTEQDWLGNYRKIEGIQRALTGMARRTKFESNMENAHITLVDYYDSLESGFHEFFPDLVAFAEKKRKELKKS